ncbi:hypothetical protein VTN02DRAFT_441 [Thermoascus thermophilus]
MGRPGFLLLACATVAPSLEHQCISDSASSCHRLSYHQSVVDRASPLVSLSTVRLPDARPPVAPCHRCPVGFLLSWRRGRALEALLTCFSGPDDLSQAFLFFLFPTMIMTHPAQGPRGKRSCDAPWFRLGESCTVLRSSCRRSKGPKLPTLPRPWPPLPLYDLIVCSGDRSSTTHTSRWAATILASTLPGSGMQLQGLTSQYRH